MSHHNPNRVPSGVREGGQFATGARAEADVSLMAGDQQVVDEAIAQLEAEDRVYPDVLQDRSGVIEQMRTQGPTEAIVKYAYTSLRAAPAMLPEDPTWAPAAGMPAGEEMYSKSYGGRSLTTDGRYRSTKEINKLIRADLKDAVAGGYLPADLTYRVRKHDSSMSSSVSISAEGMSVDDYFDRRDALRGYGEPTVQPSPYVREVEKRLGRIAFQYNWDGSDSQSDYWDVNFYQNADVTDPLNAASARCYKAKTKAVKLHRAGDIDGAHAAKAELEAARVAFDATYDQVQAVAEGVGAEMHHNGYRA